MMMMMKKTKKTNDHSKIDQHYWATLNTNNHDKGHQFQLDTQSSHQSVLNLTYIEKNEKIS